MRSFILANAFALTISAWLAPPAFAQAPTKSATAPAVAATAADTVAAAAMTTGTTAIGDMLDNPAAKAVLQKHLPEVASSDQIDMARAMTLKDIQGYATDSVTDAKLASIDHDLAALKK